LLTHDKRAVFNEEKYHLVACSVKDCIIPFSQKSQ
jgi:hypothetical protein